MATLNARLMALEQLSKATRCPAGLGYFYDTMEVLDTVGGGNALIERMDASMTTKTDRDAMAALPGGEKRIRGIVTSLARFYP